MTELSKFYVCTGRCPEDYGFPEVHQKIMSRLSQKPDVEVIEKDCVGVCTRLGGAAMRPEGGIGNFQVVNSEGLKDGIFAFNEEEKVAKVYIK